MVKSLRNTPFFWFLNLNEKDNEIFTAMNMKKIHFDFEN